MVDQPEGVSTYPLPPKKYYTVFTDENKSNGRIPKPPKPPEGEYSVFGVFSRIDDPMILPLESQNIKKLYGSDDETSRVEEMKKITKSILITYLDLLHILSNNITSPDRLSRIEHIKILFINLHHMVNEFRPHQGIETVRTVIEHQTKQKNEAKMNIQNALEKSRSTMKYCEDMLNNYIAGNTKIETGLKQDAPTLQDQVRQVMSSGMIDFAPERSLQDEMAVLCGELEGVMQQNDPMM